jgi:hypothetical protein
VADLLNVLTRIQMEYIEMPDLKLTLWQARRLWNLEVDVCQAALGALVDARFLWQTRDGAYLRRTGSAGTIEA